MNKIWIALLEKRALSYLIITTVLVFGIFSIVSMRKESSPEVQIPVAIVTTALAGAAPEDVESLVTDTIEDAVDTIEDVKKITSSSREGVSTVVVEFQADADLERSIQKVRDEVTKVRGDLPNDATEPSVTDINFADQPILIAALSSDLPTTEFKDLADSVQTMLENISGVSRVEVSGVREREVIVIVDKETLYTYKLSLSDIVGQIAAQNTEFPIGTIEQHNIEYTLSLKSALNATHEVALLPITTPSGAVLPLGDIATVSDSVANPSTISRVSIDGTPSQQAATLMVYKQRGADITAITDAVVAALANLDASSNALSTYVSFNAGDQIKKDLAQLTRVGFEAVALVMGVLFATLGWREALTAGLSIPLSLFVSFIALRETGNTINFISLFSLILSIGILVDSAIVVVEAIHVNMMRGFDKVEAARRALIEYSKPLTAGTLTTVAVFVPLFTISGVTGEFIKSIPFTVNFVLLASIVVALGMTPILAVHMLKQRSTSHLEEAQEKFTEQTRMWYKARLGAFLDNHRTKKHFVWGIIGAFIVALLLPIVGLVKATFFPQSDIEYIYVEIEDLQGTPLSVTDLHTRAIEDALYTVPEIDSFTTTVGAGSSFNDNASRGSRYASININLREDRARTSSEIVEDLKHTFSVYSKPIIRVYEPNNGPPSGAPVKITFSGENMNDLKRVAQDARAVLKDIQGTTDVISSAESDTSEFSLHINRRTAAELGVSPLMVAQTLRTAVYGTEATTIKQGGDEVKVTVKLALNPNFTTPRDAIRTNIDTLRSIPIPTRTGSVLLGSVVTMSLESANEVITHEKGARIMTVTSRLASGVYASDVVTAFENAAKEKLTIPDGIAMVIGGENEDVNQSFRDMFRALILGVLLILVVLVIEFNQFRTSLLVLSVVPLSLIGVLGGLLITRQPISFPTMLGFIALAGVVVNHAIILVDVFNRLRHEYPEKPLRDVVVEGATIRLRPILLTKITSIIGLIPLLFASDLWQPIAVAMIFGLSFTGVLTLILLPALYLKFCKYDSKK